MIKNRRQAFTLAETLITLAVIGVVASLTIPTLMKSYQKSQWIAGYKQTYSIVNQATRMIMADNGGTLVGAFGSGFSNHQGMYNAYIPYLKKIKSCESMDPLGNCFASSYTYLNGNVSSLNTDHSLILSNGASVAFEGCMMAPNLYFIQIDINGSKGPNVTGKDFHTISINTNSDPVKPNMHDSSEVNINSTCPPDLNSSLGSSCGVRILRGDYGEDY